MAKDQQSLIPRERIEQAIILARGEKVMLDQDLASLYGVPTKQLLQPFVETEAAFQETSCLNSPARRLNSCGHKM
jgi:hypothetical protein